MERALEVLVAVAKHEPRWARRPLEAILCPQAQGSVQPPDLAGLGQEFWVPHKTDIEGLECSGKGMELGRIWGTRNG